MIFITNYKSTKILEESESSRGIDNHYHKKVGRMKEGDGENSSAHVGSVLNIIRLAISAGSGR